jgi:hypothetical protein
MPSHEHMHEERTIPQPLAQLKEAPLDVYPDCDPALLNGSPDCQLLLLYADRIDVLNWEKQSTSSINIGNEFQSPIRSRAPAGKILPFRTGFLILESQLNSPLFLDAKLQTPPSAMREKLEGLPLPEPGANTFMMKNGRFYDFEYVSQIALAVIDTSQKLQVGSSGTLITADKPVGGTFWYADSTFYTSSPSSANENDQVLKFRYFGESILYQASHPVEGQIIDLTVTDLNQDHVKELIVTSINSRGIFMEATDLF